VWEQPAVPESTNRSSRLLYVEDDFRTRAAGLGNLHATGDHDEDELYRITLAKDRLISPETPLLCKRHYLSAIAQREALKQGQPMNTCD
jgi:hypothetical protein